MSSLVVRAQEIKNERRRKMNSAERVGGLLEDMAEAIEGGGLQGEQGEQGIQGETGPAGAQGIQGEQGIAGAAAGDSVISGFVRGSGTVANTDTVTQAINKIDGNVVDTLAIYRTIYSANGHVAAAQASGSRGFLESGAQAVLINVATTPALLSAFIRSADFPTITGKTAKLRVCGQVSINATKPSSDFTFSLYRLTSPIGVSGSLRYTWTLVAGSETSVIVDPSASTITDSVSSDFAIPDDGLYALVATLSAETAASSHCHLSVQLQTRHA
jgi:hypothetical protein